MKKSKKAQQHLRVLASRQVRELRRLLNEELQKKYKKQLEIYEKILAQERLSKDKINGIYKPYTTCIAKGKAGTPYEFGNKVGMITTSRTRIVIVIKAFAGNPHDYGECSSTVNAMLSATAWNLMKMMRHLRAEWLSCVDFLGEILVRILMPFSRIQGIQSVMINF